MQNVNKYSPQCNKTVISDDMNTSQLCIFFCLHTTKQELGTADVWEILF